MLCLRQPSAGARRNPPAPAVKPITSFEQGNPFEGGAVVAAHATDGAKALRIDKALRRDDRRAELGGLRLPESGYLRGGHGPCR